MTARKKAQASPGAGSANTADIVAVLGASGSGKSTYIKRRLRKEKPKRLIVWDPQEEYGEFGTAYTDPAQVLAAAQAAGTGRLAVVYRPRGDSAAWKRQFSLICKIAYAAGGVFLVAEELADVTTPSWAPEGWSTVTRKGRHRGMRVIGASQRPANIDKTFFGNATAVRTGRLNFESDVKVVANVIGCPADTVRNLLPLEWMEKNMTNGTVTSGKITF